jgi:dehydrogenase/reductase SDR family protein 12
VCRNQERGEQARADIIEKTACPEENVSLLIGDCGLKTDVEKIVREFKAAEERPLHCLVCNAGALTNQKTLTSEGYETTFAVHLLFGTYYLTRSLLDSGAFSPASEGPRVVVVSSGGMYNSKFPGYIKAKNPTEKNYDGALMVHSDLSPRFPNTLNSLPSRPPQMLRHIGQMAYVYAKRGQVLLCDRFTKKYENTGVKFMSCHPGE